MHLRSALGLTLAAALLPACADKSPTALVVAISSEGRLPDDIDRLQILVDRPGVAGFHRVYELPTSAPLPGTITVENEAGHETSTPVTVTLQARHSSEGGSDDPKTGAWKVVRRATLGFVAEKTKLLRMPLRYSCYDFPCEEGLSCVGGVCKKPDLDPARLPDFVSNEQVNLKVPDEPSAANAPSLPCFAPVACLQGAHAVALDAGTCSFDAGYPPKEFHVAMQWQDSKGKKLVVTDLSDEEGYTVDGSRVTLTEGYCKAVSGQGPRGHATATAFVSPRNGCKLKTPEVPICSLPTGQSVANPPPPTIDPLPTCTDGTKNGDETDADCGGSCPSTCADGKGCGAPADCQSGACTGGVCAPAACDDKVKNGSETDTDCGGPACGATCADGKGCGAPADCQSGVCSGGLCQPAACDDKVKNGPETDLDCGGPCSPCADGKGCGAASDCTSSVCQANVCAPAACGDNAKNGGEGDTDCGGPCPQKCADGKSCAGASDCESQVCSGNVCQKAACDDKVKNGSETDKDCGGGGCPACADGLGCGAPADCTSGVCQANVCAPAACGDGTKNGTESDQDCGGSCPSTCADGKGCGVASDCQSGVCDGTSCLAPTCSDTVKNGSETDKDCGGKDCSPCTDGLGCSLPGDCASGVCQANVCAPAACGDGAKNGDESDKDCGGSCPQKCAGGAACGGPADCASSVCTGSVCQVPACDDKAQNGNETDKDCGGKDCSPCADTLGCSLPGDCASGVCDQSKCSAPLCTDGVMNGDETDKDCGAGCPPCAAGLACKLAEDCASSVCTGNVCQPPLCTDGVPNGSESDKDCGGSCPPCIDGAACGGPADCASQVCTGNVCAPAACNDKVKNGDESDTDCGGSCAARCGTDAACFVNSDCMDQVCTAGKTCAAAACDDKVKNGIETGPDCGGFCGPCDDNLGCNSKFDCKSGVCSNNVCAPPSCTDGVQNGNETDVDCGGSSPCGFCGANQKCTQNSDCNTNTCVGGTGKCAGQLGAARLFAAGGPVTSVQLARYPGADNHLDIYAVAPTLNQALVFGGNGDGTFGFPAPFNSTGITSLTVGPFFANDTANAMALGGIDAINGDYLHIYKGGSLTPTVNFGASSPGPAIASVTNTGDGRPDILYLAPSQNKLYAYLNSDGSPGPASASTCENPVALTAGNFTFYNDVVVACYDSGTKIVSLQIVTVTSSPLPGSIFNIPQSLSQQTNATSDRVAVHAADMDKDNKADLLITCGTTLAVRLKTNDTSTNFKPDTFSSGLVSQVTAIVTTDLDGDGKLDVVTAHYDTSNLTVLMGDGLGGFKSIQRHSTCNKPTSLAVGDLDSFGNLPDIVVGCEGDQAVAVHRNGFGF